MNLNITSKELAKLGPLNITVNGVSYSAESSAITVLDSDTEEKEDEEIGDFRGVPYRYPSAIKRKLRSSDPTVTKKYTLEHDSGVEHNNVVIELTGRNAHGTSRPRGLWTGERRLPSGGIAKYSFQFASRLRFSYAKITCAESEFYADFDVKEDFIFFSGALSNATTGKPLLEFTNKGYRVFSAWCQLSAAVKADLIEAAMLEKEES